MAKPVLINHKVLITRPGAQGKALCEALERAQVACEHIPAINILENPNKLPEQKIVSLFLASELIIAISANAVNYCKLLTPKITKNTPVLAIGKSTQQVLIQHKNYHEQQIVLPKEYSTEGLLQLEILQQIKNRKIALICGVGGRELLEQVLIERGAVCTRIETYQRMYPGENEAKLQQQLAVNDFNKVVITSGQALENLVKMSGGQLPALLKLQLIVISHRLANLAVDIGFTQPALIIKNADNAAIMKLLKKG